MIFSLCGCSGKPDSGLNKHNGIIVRGVPLELAGSLFDKNGEIGFIPNSISNSISSDWGMIIKNENDEIVIRRIITQDNISGKKLILDNASKLKISRRYVLIVWPLYDKRIDAVPDLAGYWEFDFKNQYKR